MRRPAQAPGHPTSAGPITATSMPFPPRTPGPHRENRMGRLGTAAFAQRSPPRGLCQARISGDCRVVTVRLSQTRPARFTYQRVVREAFMMFDGRRSVTMILAVTGAVGLTAAAGSGGAVAGTRTAVPPGAAAVNGTWRTAREVPGTAALSKGDAQVSAVPCASAGNCSAGGFYTGRNGYPPLRSVPPAQRDSRFSGRSRPGTRTPGN